MDFTPKLLLLASLVPAAVCCGGGYLMLSSVADVKTRRARDFGDEVVRRVTHDKGWDAKALRESGSDQFRKQYTEVELAQTVTGPPGRTLGAYRSGKGFAKVVERGLTRSTHAVVDYQNQADFDHGSAVVKMELTEEPGNRWAVSSFTVAPNLSR